MAQVTVIAHFMHENEEAAAAQTLANPTMTPGFIVGTLDDSEIQALEQQGVIVEVLETDPVDLGPQPLRRRPAALRDSGPMPYNPTDPDYYQVWLEGPMLETRKLELMNFNVELHERLPDGSMVLRIPPDQVDPVSNLSYVRGFQLYGRNAPATNQRTAGQRRRDQSRGSRTPAPTPALPAEQNVYDVILHREEDRAQLEHWLATQNVTILGVSRRKIRIELPEGSELIADLEFFPLVDRVTDYTPPKLYNDRARKLLGLEVAKSPSGAVSYWEIVEAKIQDRLEQAHTDPESTTHTSRAWSWDAVEDRVGDILPQTGRGQVIGVADTGIDATHPDLASRIVGIVARGRPYDASDPDGHGTHVAGSIAGDGTCSAGAVRGTAPGVQLYIQSLMDKYGHLTGLPVDLYELFEEAYLAGVRIHNNSWGADAASRYMANSLEVDEFVADHRDMLVVVAAGNEGSAASPRNSRRGYVDWLSMATPASAKNALTVGASRSDRTQGGYAAQTWGNLWHKDYPDDPIAIQMTSGDPHSLAAFSSRGPCDDMRIKPDLVAPGTNILSTRSATAPGTKFWGLEASNDNYAYMGGTSMAAPLVSGCAALVREYYQMERHHNPSAALLKATLINSTRWLTGPDAEADHAKLPNYHQGFGCLYMPWAIPNDAEPLLKLDFWDRWEDTGISFQTTGTRYRFQFEVGGHYPLRLALVWTDAPGRSIQNDLDLFLEYRQTRQKWFGNADARRLVNAPDRENTVEVIRLDNPQPGSYLIQVTAHNILRAPQDFALVVTGDLTAPLTPYLGF
jgi:serine protease AprX